jgi:uncharacterized protein YcbX
MSEHQSVAIAGLFVHPVKSCARVAVDLARLIDTGLEWDREWMVVDDAGEFVSQRGLPRMALVQPAIRGNDMMLRAPGMLALHVSLDAVEEPRRVRVWDDTVDAYDMGDLAAQWFSDFLGRPLRLSRFDPEFRRRCDAKWAGDTEAVTAFADGFPLLVLSSASIDELNRRLQAQGRPPVNSERFRPNLVLDGLDAHGEDWLDRIEFDTPGGPVVLRMVKPCSRCAIPDVDPARGEADGEVNAIISGYRADTRLGGQITFGMNAVIETGLDRELRVGLTGRASVRFD